MHSAPNAYEAIQIAKALYGKLLISEGANLVWIQPRMQFDDGRNGHDLRLSTITIGAPALLLPMWAGHMKVS